MMTSDSEDLDVTERIISIDTGLSRYYRSQNWKYNQIFSKYCHDNGLDDDAIDEDYAQGDPLNLTTVDFAKDDDEKLNIFPFGTEAPSSEIKKAAFIWNIITKIDANPDIKFDSTAPKYDIKHFEIQDKHVTQIKVIYKKQCPTIYYQGVSTDYAFLQILAISDKHKDDYILNLVDDYSRARVENIKDKTFNASKWMEGHKHFKKTKTIKNPLIKDNNNNNNNNNDNKVKMHGNYADLIKHAVESFSKRCCAQLMFNGTKLINDSLEQIVSYIHGAVTSVTTIIKTANKTNKGIVPFQIDFCIATGKPIKKNQAENDGSDDDDDDEEEDKFNDDSKDFEFVDLIGDVPAKMEKNKLKHTMTQYNFEKPPQPNKIDRLFVSSLEKLEDKKMNEESGFVYPRNKRLVVLIDRRKSKNDEELSDDICAYEPPSFDDIPDEAVSLWGISASKTCLLPNINYSHSEAINEPNANKLNDEKQEKIKGDENIGSTNHCKCSLLTFSFIVKKEDVIKMYMYFGGTFIRFFPEDIKTVLPTIFNMDYGGNKDYIKNSKELDEMIDEMKKKVVDVDFKKFQENY